MILPVSTARVPIPEARAVSHAQTPPYPANNPSRMVPTRLINLDGDNGRPRADVLQAMMRPDGLFNLVTTQARAFTLLYGASLLIRPH